METIQVKVDVQVDYAGCESEQERAKVRVDAKHKARQQVKTQPELLEALEKLYEFANEVQGAFQSIGVEPPICKGKADALLAIAKATP